MGEAGSALVPSECCVQKGYMDISGGRERGAGEEEVSAGRASKMPCPRFQGPRPSTEAGVLSCILP